MESAFRAFFTSARGQSSRFLDLCTIPVLLFRSLIRFSRLFIVCRAMFYRVSGADFAALPRGCIPSERNSKLKRAAQLRMGREGNVISALARYLITLPDYAFREGRSGKVREIFSTACEDGPSNVPVSLPWQESYGTFDRELQQPSRHFFSLLNPAVYRACFCSHGRSRVLSIC